MIVKPTADNIVIKLPRQEKELKTGSGIIIKAQVQSKPDRGEVVAVGEGRFLNNGDLIPPAMQAGDTVLFNRFAGTEIQSGEDTYLIVRENDILAVILNE